MVGSERPGELTDAGYWDARWGKGKRARRKRINRRTRVIADLVGRLGPSAKAVLEVGCAPGEMIELMHVAGPQHRYHGLDYAEGGIAETRARLGGLGIAVELHHADVRDFQPGEGFDMVCSFGVIEHYEDIVPILKDHARCARPGGLVAVTVPNYSPKVVEWFIRRLDPDALDRHNLKIMAPPVLAQAMRDAGLVDVESGAGGPPRLRTGRGKVTPVRYALRVTAKLWNALTRVLPDGVPWAATLWAVGRKP